MLFHLFFWHKLKSTISSNGPKTHDTAWHLWSPNPSDGSDVSMKSNSDELKKAGEDFPGRWKVQKIAGWGVRIWNWSEHLIRGFAIDWAGQRWVFHELLAAFAEQFIFWLAAGQKKKSILRGRWSCWMMEFKIRAGNIRKQWRAMKERDMWIGVI